MSAAIERVERLFWQLERNGHQPPDFVTLTHYTPESFARLRPGERYDDWRRDQDDVLAWLRARGIRVDEKAPDKNAMTSADRAASVASKPYRLGMSIGGYSGSGQMNALGWFIVWLEYFSKGGELS